MSKTDISRSSRTRAVLFRDRRILFARPIITCLAITVDYERHVGMRGEGSLTELPNRIIWNTEYFGRFWKSVASSLKTTIFTVA